MTPSPPLSFHDQGAVQGHLDSLRAPKTAYTQLRKAVFRQGLGWDRALGTLPAPLASLLRETVVFSTLTLDREEWAADGSVKAQLRTWDGHLVEAVVIRTAGRSTLCVSSQIGCAMGCAFCSTGQLSVVRDLSAAEILEQASWAAAELARTGERLRNVVFMGMGEPLLTLDAVSEAIGGLLDQRRFEIAPRYLSLSTCGVVPAIEPFGKSYPRVKIAVSLHAPRQSLRDALMPGCRNWPLSDLMPALDKYAERSGHRLFFEYIMIRDVNDTAREADELVGLLGARDAHVNLIPYNAGPRADWKASDRSRLDLFQRRLIEAGIPATVRKSAGEEIAAACGQLAGKVPWANSNGKASSRVEANTN